MVRQTDTARDGRTPSTVQVADPPTGFARRFALLVGCLLLVTAAPAGVAAAETTDAVGSDESAAAPTVDSAERATNASGNATAGADESITLDTEGEFVRVERSETATVTGETTLSPGTNLRVVVMSDDGVEPGFVIAERATVDENGSFAASFNLSVVPPGSTFRITVSGNGTEGQGVGVVVPRNASVGLPAVDGTLQLVSGEVRGVTIATGLPADTPVTVRLLPPDGPAVELVETTVNESGRTTVELSPVDLEPGPFRLEVRAGPLTLATLDAQVVTETTPTVGTENVTFGTVAPTDGALPDGAVGLAGLGVAALLAIVGVRRLLGS